MYKVICELGTMVPGAVGIVTVPVLFTPEHENFDSVSASFGWGVSYDEEGTWGLNYENDTAWAEVVFCDDPSSNPGCQQLP